MIKRSMWALLLAGLVGVTACEKGPPAAPTAPVTPGGRTDDAWGFSFVTPTGWAEGKKSGFTVPGEMRYALIPAGSTTGSGASISIFLQKPGKEFTARKLLDISVEGMKKVGADIKSQEVRKLGGMTSMWMEIAGPGTGAAVIPGGKVRTTQIWAAIPRGNDVLVLLLTAPEESAAAQKPAFDALVESLKLTGAQSAEQTSSS